MCFILHRVRLPRSNLWIRVAQTAGAVSEWQGGKLYSGTVKGKGWTAFRQPQAMSCFPQIEAEGLSERQRPALTCLWLRGRHTHKPTILSLPRDSSVHNTTQGNMKVQSCWGASLWLSPWNSAVEKQTLSKPHIKPHGKSNFRKKPVSGVTVHHWV